MKSRAARGAWVPGRVLVIADRNLDQAEQQRPAVVVFDLVEALLECLVRFEELARVEAPHAVERTVREPIRGHGGGA